jgi:hypothetical protein
MKRKIYILSVKFKNIFNCALWKLCKTAGGVERLGGTQIAPPPRGRRLTLKNPGLSCKYPR